MALNQASNPSKLMHTSSIPILRISLKNLEKRKYLLRVFLCKGSILNLNYASESDIGDVICNTYTTEDGVCKPFNVGPGIYLVQIDSLDELSKTPVAQRLLVIEMTRLWTWTNQYTVLSCSALYYMLIFRKDTGRKLSLRGEGRMTFYRLYLCDGQ